MKRRLKKKLDKKGIAEHGVIYDSICLKVNKGNRCEHIYDYNMGYNCTLHNHKYNYKNYIDKCPIDCPYKRKLQKYAKHEADITYNMYIDFYAFKKVD